MTGSCPRTSYGTTDLVYYCSKEFSDSENSRIGGTDHFPRQAQDEQFRKISRIVESLSMDNGQHRKQLTPMLLLLLVLLLVCLRLRVLVLVLVLVRVLVQSIGTTVP